MSNMGPAAEAACLAALLTTCFVSLHTADPGATGANEVVGGSYARLSAAFSNSGTNPTIASNTGVLTFPTATGSWGTITHFGIWSALTGGNFLIGDLLGSSRVIAAADIARFPVAALSVSAS